VPLEKKKSLLMCVLLELKGIRGKQSMCVQFITIHVLDHSYIAFGKVLDAYRQRKESAV
jgi:hypothetical protein